MLLVRSKPGTGKKKGLCVGCVQQRACTSKKKKKKKPNIAFANILGTKVELLVT